MKTTIRRLSPPRWVKAALYGAHWPEHRDFRLGLQRQYLRDLKRIGKPGADRRARELGRQFILSCVGRAFWVVVALGKGASAIARMFF